MLDILTGCAKRGERCPAKGELRRLLSLRGIRPVGNVRALLVELARQGKIIINIHAHNWRTVEIFENGKFVAATQTPPRPWAVYKVADRRGYHMVDA